MAGRREQRKLRWSRIAEFSFHNNNKFFSATFFFLFLSPSLIFSNTRFILNYIFQHSHSQVARRSNSKHHEYSVILHLGQKLFMNEQQSAKNLNNSVILLER